MHKNAIEQKIGDAPLSHVEQILLNEFTKLQHDINQMRAEGARMKERIRMLENPGLKLSFEPNMVAV